MGGNADEPRKVVRCGTCSFTCLCKKACDRCCYCLAPAVGPMGPVEQEMSYAWPQGVWWDHDVIGGGR